LTTIAGVRPEGQWCGYLILKNKEEGKERAGRISGKTAADV
jgi:hypothetical protein